MNKTLTWEVYCHLTRKELKAFDIFLRSRFFNTRQDLIILNQFLSKECSTKKPAPSKEKVFSVLPNNEAYDDKKFTLLLSYLHKILEKFLYIQEIEHTDFEKEKLLIAAYRKKGMSRNFSRTLKKTQFNLVNNALRNPTHYFIKFELEHQKHLSLVETGRAKELNLEIVERNLDLAYISTKLQRTCITLSHQSVFNRKYESALFQPLMKLAQQGPYKKEPAIALYHEFLVLFQEGGISEFENFKANLFKQSHYFTIAEFRDLYLLSLNFCIKQVNNNQKSYYAETFDMYKKGIEMKLLLDKGRLTPFSFNNIVGIAIRQTELNWAEDFINKHKDFLDKTHKTPSVSLNMARVEFAKENYNAALVFLQKADYDDPINHMTAKILQLKTYYELQEFNTLDSFIQSLSVLIRRRKRKLGYHYQIWRNILKYTKKLRKVNPYDQKAVEALIELIINEKVLPEREWLLSKLREGQ